MQETRIFFYLCLSKPNYCMLAPRGNESNSPNVLTTTHYRSNIHIQIYDPQNINPVTPLKTDTNITRGRECRKHLGTTSNQECRKKTKLVTPER